MESGSVTMLIRKGIREKTTAQVKSTSQQTLKPRKGFGCFGKPAQSARCLALPPDFPNDNLFNVPRRYGKSSPMGIPHVIIVTLGTRLTRCIRRVAVAALGFLHRQEFMGMPLAPIRSCNPARSC